MTKAELEQLKLTVKQWLFHTGALDPTNYANELKSKFIEPREKRIEELEKQIEKMKCCGNCQKLKQRFDGNTNINILYCSDCDMRLIEVGFQM